MMAEEVRLGGAFVLALAVTLAATPLARWVALRTDFADHPVGYKGHSEPTPYLGGTAVAAGLLASVAVFGGGLENRGLLAVCALGLLVVGTIDDRVGLGILPRLAAQVAVAVALWAGGYGWELFGSEAANLAVTLVWVLGLINALNLMDNLDGATGGVGAASAAGIAAIAIISDEVALAVLALALAGACIGFLPQNLASPSRIFLGDGGSFLIGFVLAVTIMAIPNGDLGWPKLLAYAPLVGLVIFDTTLVVISRRRRDEPIFEGGRDHLTHRLLGIAGSPRRVAAILAAAQGLLCALAVALHELDDGEVIAAGAVYLTLGALALLVFERRPLVSRAAERPL